MLILKICLTLFSLLLGVASVHAEVAEAVRSTHPIVDHIRDVQQQTLDLAAAVQNFSGDTFDSFPISRAGRNLLKAIEEGTETAKSSKKVSVTIAIKIKTATKKLLKDIESSLAILIHAKPKLDHAGITIIMVSKLKDDQEEANRFIAAIVDKLPPVGKRTGRKLGKKIAAAFEFAISVFSEEL
ncbi:hypothetical protein N8I77_013623 [Diaporthe amygdali]|uniref:Uncharacterized protein n=1 Tax=Phomopsis amygdali TaxID=1214568 RepID=A0AAD9S0P6_PHOAM|nr:hypothetical protein N8I77_013623 [Diaporthe amygdali]